jgi:hypothetical protein
MLPISPLTFIFVLQEMLFNILWTFPKPKKLNKDEENTQDIKKVFFLFLLKKEKRKNIGRKAGKFDCEDEHDI